MYIYIYILKGRVYVCKYVCVHVCVYLCKYVCNVITSERLIAGTSIKINFQIKNLSPIFIFLPEKLVVL